MFIKKYNLLDVDAEQIEAFKRYILSALIACKVVARVARKSNSHNFYACFSFDCDNFLNKGIKIPINYEVPIIKGVEVIEDSYLIGEIVKQDDNQYYFSPNIICKRSDIHSNNLLTYKKRLSKEISQKLKDAVKGSKLNLQDDSEILYAIQPNVNFSDSKVESISDYSVERDNRSYYMDALGNKVFIKDKDNILTISSTIKTDEGFIMEKIVSTTDRTGYEDFIKKVKVICNDLLKKLDKISDQFESLQPINQVKTNMIRQIVTIVDDTGSEQISSIEFEKVPSVNDIKSFLNENPKFLKCAINLTFRINGSRVFFSR